MDDFELSNSENEETDDETDDETGRPQLYITKDMILAGLKLSFRFRVLNRKSKQFGTQRSANTYSFFNYIVFNYSNLTIFRLAIIAAKCSYP